MDFNHSLDELVKRDKKLGRISGRGGRFAPRGGK